MLERRWMDRQKWQEVTIALVSSHIGLAPERPLRGKCYSRQVRVFYRLVFASFSRSGGNWPWSRRSRRSRRRLSFLVDAIFYFCWSCWSLVRFVPFLSSAPLSPLSASSSSPRSPSNEDGKPLPRDEVLQVAVCLFRRLGGGLALSTSRW